MKPLSAVVGALGLLLAVAPADGRLRKSATKALADYVNPLGGTDSTVAFSRGNLYPAVSVPFGMNAWTPQTGENGDGWTYQYSAIRIRGLKLTHQPSPWINDYGALSLMPVTGELKVREKERASLFSHAREEAHPYGYKVKLMDYGVWAEVAPTSRGAVLRFTFPQDRQGVRRPRRVSEAAPARRRARLEDRSGVRRGGPGTAPHHRRVALQLRRRARQLRPLLRRGVRPRRRRRGRLGRERRPEGRPGAKRRPRGRLGALPRGRGRRRAGEGRDLVHQPEQAQLNFDREVGRRSFDEVKRQAARDWEELLGRVAVEGATEAAKEVFYSCLYRGSLFPRDVPRNGRRGADGPLQPVQRPGRAGAAVHRQRLLGHVPGGLPAADDPAPGPGRPDHAGHRQRLQGERLAPRVAEPGPPGLHDRHQLVVHPRRRLDQGHSRLGRRDRVGRHREGRARRFRAPLFRRPAGCALYDRLGYVPSDVGINESAARTLEYGFDDFCNWRLGRALGKPEAEIGKYASGPATTETSSTPPPASCAGAGRTAPGRSRSGPMPGAASSPKDPPGTGPGASSTILPGSPRCSAATSAWRRKLDSVFTAAPTNEYSYYGGDDPRDRRDGRGRHGPVRPRQPADPAHDLPLQLGGTALEGAVLGAPDDGPDVPAGSGHVLRGRGQRPDLGVVRDVGDGLLPGRSRARPSSRWARRSSTG